MVLNLDDEQEKIMDEFITKHNKSKTYKVNRQRIKYSKKHKIQPCGGWCQYHLQVTFTTIGFLTNIECTCGAKEYLGEV